MSDLRELNRITFIHSSHPDIGLFRYDDERFGALKSTGHERYVVIAKEEGLDLFELFRLLPSLEGMQKQHKLAEGYLIIIFSDIPPGELELK